MDRKSRRYITLGIALILTLTLLSLGAVWFTSSIKDTGDTTDIFPDDTSQIELETPPAAGQPGSHHSESQSPGFLNLQPTLNAWLAKSPAQSVGIVIYDLDHDQIAAQHNPEQVFSIASLYKLFYAYDGYSRIDSGNDDGKQTFATTPKGKLTLYQCLDLAIRESYNPCAEPLRTDVTRTRRVERLVKKLRLKNTSLSDLTSTAADLTTLLRHIYRHCELSDDSWSRLQDSLLNQPATTYDWRQGLPAGFKKSEVYNKVGWNSLNGKTWDLYHDAALVDTNNRHYAIVVLTKNPTSSARLSELGQQIENYVIINS